MFRIDNSTAQGNFPTIPPVGVPGYFFHGNPVAGIPATIVDDWWLATVQEEIAHVIENAGIALNKFDHGQLFQAIQALIAAAGGGGGGPDYDPYLPLIGGTIYNPGTGGSDPLKIYTDAGLSSRIQFQSGIARLWMAGSDAAGNFVFTDQTANQHRAWIDPSGAVSIQNNLHVFGTTTSEGSIWCNGDISHVNNVYAVGAVFIGTRGLYINDTGNPQNQLFTNGGWWVGGQLNINSDIFCGTNIHCNNYLFIGTHGLTLNDAGNNTIWCGGAFTSASNLSPNAAVFIGTRNLYINDSGNSNNQLFTPAGFYISGRTDVGGTLYVTGSAYCAYGSATYNFQAGQDLYAGNNIHAGGLSFNDSGNGQFQTDAGWWMNGILSVNNNINTGYNITMGGFLTANGGDGNNFGVIIRNGGLYVGGSQSTVQHLSASGGICIGSTNSNGMNMDYSFNWNIASHMQTSSGIGLYAQFFTPYSDAELKRNIEPVERDALAAIRPLRFFSYDSPRATPDGEVIDARSHVAVGFLAQQVRESLADAVVETDQPTVFHEDHPADGPAGCGFDTRPVLGLDIMVLLAYSLRAIQQLADRVETIEGRA